MYRHNRLYFQCFGIVSFGIGKYMQVADVKTMDKIEGLFEIFICFARKSHNYIYTNTTVRHETLYPCHSFGVQLPAVAAAHGTKYFIIATLQRDMEVWHKLLAASSKGDYFFCKQVRFY